MKEVIVVCEGQTEETFVNEILAPALWDTNVFLSPRLIATSRHSKGGSPKGQRVLRFLRNTLRERQNTYVTTFFDLYGLPSDFPGRAETAREMDPVDQAVAVETVFHAAVIDIAKCRPDRFLPHIQPFEFEALLFSDPGKFAEVEPAWRTYVGPLEVARQSVRSPEYINDGFESHPSARLQNLLRPRYSTVARPDEELDQAVRQIISRAVAPEGVIDIFAAAGLEKPDISILSDQFLAEVRGMPQRNLAVELLQKLLKGELATRRRKNVVQARSFAEMLEQTLRRYQNRTVEAAQVIEELIQLARELREASARGEKLGLSEDELAFYDAFTSWIQKGRCNLTG